MAETIKPAGLVVDHRQTAFCLLSDDLVRSVMPAGATPAARYPVAFVLRPDLLPLYAVLVAELGKLGIKRRAFLSQQDAFDWVSRQAR